METINEQYPLRAGRITASRCAEFMGNGKGEPFGEIAKTYAKELLMIRLGIEIDKPTTWQMEWGIEHEPDARAIYAKSRNVRVDMPGFITYGDYCGCIPDGVIVDTTGLLEIKCPQYKAHFDFLLSGQPDKKYWQQMQFQMMCTNTDWCDFMSFNPTFPDKLKAKVVRIERDNDYIELIESRIEPFEEMIAEMREKLGV